MVESLMPRRVESAVMAKWARVTMDDGTVWKPVLVHDDGQGLRFYGSKHGRVVLLGAQRGLRIVSFGERPKRVPGQPRPEKSPVVFAGALIPAGFALIERLETCGCGSVLKSYQPPNTWETVSAGT